MLAALDELGVSNVRDEVRILPDRDKLGGKIHGVCRVRMALTFADPQRSALQTELLYGEPVWLLDRDGDYLLVHGSDGYWGWLPVEAIELLDAAAFAEYTCHDFAVLKADLSRGEELLPRGALLPVKTRRGDAVTLLLPDGETLAVPAQNLRDSAHKDADEQRVRWGLAIARYAVRLRRTLATRARLQRLYHEPAGPGGRHAAARRLAAGLRRSAGGDGGGIAAVFAPATCSTSQLRRQDLAHRPRNQSDALRPFRRPGGDDR